MACSPFWVEVYWVVELDARAGERAAAQREELLRARVTHGVATVSYSLYIGLCGMLARTRTQG